jgi:hypothetical protein
MYRKKAAKTIRKKLVFCWHLGSYWRKEQDPDSDPYQNITDPEHWFLHKIYNGAF